MSLQVYIDNKLLDLLPKEKVALTKQINDVADIQKRQADFTNRFLAPKTPNNKDIAMYLNVPGNASTRPYKWSTARIISNGIPIVQNGIALLTETNIGYEFIIYSGNYDLFSKIDGKYITDIDWTDLIHTFNQTEFTDSWSNTDGYIYPVAETLEGSLKTLQEEFNAIDIRYQFPHVFVKTIFERIFAEAGLEFNGTFFSTNTQYLNELVPACRNWAKDVTTPFDYFKGNNPLTPNAIILDDVAPVTLVNHIVDINTVVTSSPNYTLFTDTYEAPEDGMYLFTLSSRLSISYLHRQNFRLKVNGVYSGSVPFAETNIEMSFGVSIQNTVLPIEILLRVGDVVTFFTEFYPGGPINALDLEITGYELEIRQLTREVIPYLSAIDFSKWLPKIKQIDFLRAIMQQYGLMYQVDTDGVYQFTTIQDLLNKVNGQSDYTLKLDSEKTESYELGSFAKTNEMTYQYDDNDKVGTAYADSSFDIDIDNLETKGTAVGSIIQASGDFLLFDNWQKIASLNTYSNFETDSSKPKQFKLNDNELLQTVILTTTNGHEVNFYNSDTNIFALSYTGWYIPVVQFAPLHWTNLKTLYYPKYISMVQAPVKKNVLIWLTPIDIFFLDMFKVVYFKQYQSYFYLNKINNFLPGKLSDCEIIKIN